MCRFFFLHFALQMEQENADRQKDEAKAVKAQAAPAAYLQNSYAILPMSLSGPYPQKSHRLNFSARQK